MTQTLKQQLQQALNIPESDFSNHESDLYVKCSPIVVNWLKANYDYHENVTMFRNQIDGLLWLDIPFGFIDEHFAQRFPSKVKDVVYTNLNYN